MAAFPPRGGRRAAAGATVVLGYGAAVGALAWASAGAWHELHRPGPPSFDTLIASTAAAGAWLCVAWLTLGFTLTALARLPNAVGRWSAAASTRVAPAVVRRLASLVLGGAIICATARSGIVPATAASTAVSKAAGTRPAAAAGSPAATPAVPPAATLMALPDLDRPAPWPHPPPRATRPASEIVVRRGDTLWGIAARHLGRHASAAQIAAEWPRWYEANRHVVGADPDLICPGQRLRVPMPAHASEETQ